MNKLIALIVLLTLSCFAAPPPPSAPYVTTLSVDLTGNVLNTNAAFMFPYNNLLGQSIKATTINSNKFDIGTSNALRDALSGKAIISLSGTKITPYTLGTNALTPEAYRIFTSGSNIIGAINLEVIGSLHMATLTADSIVGNGIRMYNLSATNILGILTNNTAGNARTATTASNVTAFVTNAWKTYTDNATNGLASQTYVTNKIYDATNGLTSLNSLGGRVRIKDGLLQIYDFGYASNELGKPWCAILISNGSISTSEPLSD